MRRPSTLTSTGPAELTTRVLVIEDPVAGGAARTLLAHAGRGRFEVVGVADAEQAVAWLAKHVADCVVLDLGMRGDGLDALGRIRAASLDAPVLVLSGPDQDELGARAVAEGAQDHLVKGQIDARGLARAIGYAIERSRVQSALAHQALHDPLTGLANRALFEDRLRQALARSRRHGVSSAVLFCDLDRFKHVNDTLGHAAGDELLVAVAGRIAGVLRTQDTAARLGGDEFAILCEDVNGTHHALNIAERLLAELRAPFPGVEDIPVGASIGLAIAHEGTERPEALLREADAAMYRAKERGGGVAELFDDAMRGRAARRIELQDALRRGLERGEMRLHYQPRVRLATGEVVGVEALVRWQHPERGLLSPAEFLPMAEESGLIAPLGGWVIEESCRQAARWAAARVGVAPLPVAVNLTARQCAQPDLLSVVRGAVDRAGIDPSGLRLEITESAVLSDYEANLAVLEALRDLGLSLAIDDFGAGPSSLAALQALPVDVVTVDRSLVGSLGRDGADAAMLGGIVGLAHALGLSIVAEGIEAVTQVDRLRALGCDAGQGFFFARPGEADALVGLLGTRA
jgi:diguanylate cyclase (GGDEF)-like protein